MLARAVYAYRAALGSRLLGGYALGSLAHGGFSQLVSDVDLGLILRDPLRPADRITIHRVARSLRTGGSPLDARLSVFWGTPSTLRGQSRGGRFPPLDRLDLLEHGRLLTGRDVRSSASCPDPGELVISGAEFALGYLGNARKPLDPLRKLARRPRLGDTVEEIRTPARLIARGPRRLTKVVLFPVRFLFTAATGEVGTNNHAVAHYLADTSRPAAALVEAALGWRLQPPAGDEATELLDRDLMHLYCYYIDDHITRLRALHHHRLADGFQQWRSRLVA